MTEGDAPAVAPGDLPHEAVVLGRVMLFDPAAVPPTLRDRGRAVVAVELLPGESPQMYGERLAWPLNPADEELLRLLAKGFSAAQTAKHLGVSQRTVQRHIAYARRRLGVGTLEALVAYLRDRAFDV